MMPSSAAVVEAPNSYPGEPSAVRAEDSVVNVADPLPSAGFLRGRQSMLELLAISAGLFALVLAALRNLGVAPETMWFIVIVLLVAKPFLRGCDLVLADRQTPQLPPRLRRK